MKNSCKYLKLSYVNVISEHYLRFLLTCLCKLTRSFCLWENKLPQKHITFVVMRWHGFLRRLLNTIFREIGVILFSNIHFIIALRHNSYKFISQMCLKKKKKSFCLKCKWLHIYSVLFGHCKQIAQKVLG